MRQVRMANPTHRYEAHRLNGPEGEPQLAWQHRFEAEINYIAVWDGTAFVVTGSTLSAVDADGTSRWRFEASGTVTSVPVVADGVVYFGCDRGTVYALSAGDGTERWRFGVERDSEQSDTGGRAGVLSSPAVVDGAVYVAASGIPVANSSLVDRIYALDARDGGVRWIVDLDGLTPCAPAVVDGTVYVGCSTPKRTPSGEVVALDADSGAQRWRLETEERIDTSPTVVDSIVYVGGDHLVSAIDANLGTLRWSTDVGGGIALRESSLAVEDGRVIVTEGAMHYDFFGGVDALDARQGNVEWRVELGLEESVSAPTLIDGTVYLGSGTEIHAISAADGDSIWRRDVGETITAQITVDGAVWVGTHEGTLRVYGEPRPSARDRGSETGVYRRCPVCDEDLSEHRDAAFCPFCGTEL